jgi:hypothetical protein
VKNQQEAFDKNIEPVIYPLPTVIVCDRPNLAPYVSAINKLQYILNERDYDLKVVELVEKIYDAGYNNGLKAMDQMHQITDRVL